MPDQGGVIDQSFRAMSLLGILAETMGECERDTVVAADTKRARAGR